MNYSKAHERYKAEHGWPAAAELDAELRREFGASAERYEFEIAQEQLEQGNGNG